MTADPDRPDLTLRALRIFVALEETGSVALAAQRLGASPSGVSQAISALERGIGARLFDRQAKPATLTPAGQVLRHHAHRILGVVSDATTELAEISLASLPALTLAIIDDLDASLTPVLVASLQARLPRCFVNAFSGRSDEIVARLVAREADIGVTALPAPDGAAFRTLPILRESFLLVAARGVLADGADVPDALTRLPFVHYSEAIPIGRAVAAHLRRLRLTLPRRMAFEATRSVLAMVAETGGWTLTTPLNLLDAERILPQLAVRAMPFAGLTRDVHLIARAEELGHLPEVMARDCRRLVRDRLLPRFAEVAPDLVGSIVVAEEPDQPRAKATI
ncbi:MAG: LysR substrate-binding domain-containing protein [Gemmobacter sp.]